MQTMKFNMIYTPESRQIRYFGCAPPHLNCHMPIDHCMNCIQNNSTSLQKFEEYLLSMIISDMWFKNDGTILLGIQVQL